MTTTVPEVTLDPNVRRNLARAAAQAREWTEKRDRRILQARQEGASLREIAEAVGLSHSAVDKIIKRDTGEVT